MHFIYVSYSLLINAVERTDQHSRNKVKIGVIFNFDINH